MPLQSFAGNEIVADLTSKMVGFTAFSNETPLAIYDFIYKPIRDADALDGELFLKRYLEGPQQAWAQTTEAILSIPELWSVTDCPDEALPYLAWTQGWTSELQGIVERLTPLQLRRLIDATPTIWNERGSADAWVEVVALLTGARAQAFTWLDLRYLVDGTATTEERQGLDTWLLEYPGDGSDEYGSNLRVVDDGTGSMDRQLVLDVLSLMRPVGERITVSWIRFLDEFREDEVSQWAVGTGGPLVASGGAATLNGSGAESAYVAAPLSDAWTDLVVFARLKGGGAQFGVSLRSSGDTNRYEVALDVAANRVRLKKVVGGVPTTLVSVPPAVGALVADVYYGLRVENAGTALRVFLDGDLVIDTTDSSLVSGTIGVWHDSSGHVSLDTIEAAAIPMDSSVVRA